MNYFYLYLIYMLLPTLFQAYRIHKDKDVYDFPTFLMLNSIVYFVVILIIEATVPGMKEIFNGN